MEFIEIYTPSKRLKKIKVIKEAYEAIHHLILTVLSADQEITLTKLIEIGEEQLGIDYHNNLSWLIVQIKNDLAYRQHIHVRIDQERNQLIRLRKKRMYYGR